MRVVDSTKAGSAMRFPSPTRFLANRRGNVAMMYALILPVLMFGTGFAIDYTHAKQVQTKLDAAADAAVLAALTPSMMQQSNAAAQTAATNLFNAIANTQTSLVATDTNVTVTVTNPNNNTLHAHRHGRLHRRQPKHLLGRPRRFRAQHRRQLDRERVDRPQHQLLSAARQFAVDGAAGDFQPASLDMESLTPQQGACAFACHQASTGNGDTQGNPCLKGSTYSTPTVASSGTPNAYCSASQGTQIDDYALARHNSIPLRLDEISTGVGDLMIGGLQRPANGHRHAARLPIRRLRDGFVLADRHVEQQQL